MMPRRRMILAILLTVSALLSLQSLMWTPGSGGAGALPDIVQPVVRANAATMPQHVPAAAAHETARADDSLQVRARQEPARAPRDLFAAYSWAPPPPPAQPNAAAAAPPPPEAPPLSFLYIGRIEVDGKSIFLLLQGDRTLHVSIGESVGEFKLTSSGPQGLAFLHQPTGLTRVLPAPGVPVVSN